MKVSVLQPHYSMNGADLDACFTELLALLDSCDDSLDLIVLPEYSDVPADVKGEAGFYEAADFISEEHHATIQEYFEETGDPSLSAAREVLGEEYSYFELKMYLLSIKMETPH